MAIKIHHTYSTNVEIHYYTDGGYTLRCRDCGQMDDIAEQVCEVLIKHNFSYADVCSVETGEVLMVIERT
jgi:hypothetical protein